MRSSENSRPGSTPGVAGPSPSLPSATTPAIRAEHLAKTFHTGFLRRPVRALVDASFSVPRGCIFSLVGPNGAGKTTTIKILMGLIRATSGTAYIDGHRVPTVASRGPVGFLPENPSFHDHLRPDEYLTLVGQLHGMSRRRCAIEAEALLALVGLSEHRRKPIRKFSKGMIQRLGIAQALVHDPEIVILDEPQSGLDPLGRKEIKDMILDLKARGRTVLFSSHILPDVEDLADEIAIMHQGRILDMGTVQALANPKVLEWQLEVSDLPQEVLTGLEPRVIRMSTQEDRVVLTLDGSVDASEVVVELAQAGGRVHQVVPYRESLEELFVRELKATEERKP